MSKGLGLESKELRFSLDKEKGTFSVMDKRTGLRWSMQKSEKSFIPPKDRVHIYAFGDYEVTQITRAWIRKVEVLEKSKNSITTKVTIRDGRLSLLLEVRYALEGEELSVEIIPLSEGPVRADADLYLPPGFSVSGKNSYFALPLGQGCILPCHKGEPVRRQLNVFGTADYMGWYGAASGKSGFLAIFETPFDAGVRIDSHAGMIAPYFRFSMGKLSYPRRLRYIFLPRAGYLELALRYRKFLIASGRFKTLSQKMKENPNVKKLLGSAEISFEICNDDVRLLVGRRVQTFAQVARKVRALKRAGIPQAIVHINGWGRLGYDSSHPDLFPPCQEAGGWDGLKALSEVTARCGYLFCLHDNYLLINQNAPNFSKDILYLDRFRRPAFEDAWGGGKTSMVCSIPAFHFLKRNFQTLLKKGIKLGASYLDQTNLVTLYECYNRKHRLTREMDAYNRLKLLGYVRALGIAVSSEGANEWSLPEVDFLYYNRFTGLGIPVPLHSLIYHDAVVTPWPISYNRDKIDHDYLKTLIYGGILCVGEGIRKTNIPAMKVVSKLHQEIGDKAMLSHRYLAKDLSKEESFFDGGVRVRVDYKKRLYNITGAKGISPGWRSLGLESSPFA